MNFYDENLTTKYDEEKNIPKKKNINKKKIIILIIISLLVLILLIIGILFFVYKNNKDKEIVLNNIVIDNNNYEPSFSNDIYDYYLLTTDKEIEIKCDINKKIEGCNEKIKLDNYSNYIHEIINEDKIYRVHIKVKDSNSEENISITSIGKNNSWTNTSQVIIVNAKSKNDIDKYSFDNGITWQESNVYTTEQNTNLKVIVKDKYGHTSSVREVIVDNIDHTNPTGIIIKESSSKNKIVLKVIAKDEESGIEGYSWENKEYSDNKEFTIKKKGTYKVKIKDKAGNIEELSINIKDSDFNDKKQTAVVLYKNGSTSIDNDFLSCTIKDKTCIVTLPSITRDNSDIIGWSTNKDGKDKEYKISEKIKLKENEILHLYAITKKEVTASFNANGATSISSKKESCTLYNDDKFCYVKAPSINYSNGKIIGWNTEKETLTVFKSPNNKIKLSKDEVFYALIYKEIVVNFNSNGSDKISSTKEVCRQQIGSNSCVIQTPNITRKSSNIIGWSTNKNDTDSSVLANEEIEVTEDSTYYAITKKEVTITFDANGSDKVGKNKVTCSFYNNAKSCKVTTPNIIRKNASILGWSTNKDSIKGEIKINQTLEVKENKTYYAITKKEVTATFISNGANKVTTSSKSCTYYNNNGGCSIKSPDISRPNWVIVGWSSNKNSTTSEVKANNDFKLKENTNYYAITYRTVTATYHKNNADSLGNCSNPQVNGCKETCNIYNLNESCEVNVPYIYSEGNEVQFFSTGTNPSTTVGYSPAKKLSILDSVTLYAIVDNRYRPYTYDIIKTKKYGYTSIETEKTCSSSVYNKYYAFLDTAYKKVPYVFSAAKVTFSGNNTFNKTWGNYAGMTYGSAVGYRNVDVKCTNTYSDYYLQTIIHELAHSWDSYFYAKKGYYLSTNNDFIKLYNKYRYSSNRPLREYAYSSMGEFIADAYAWYYFLYIDTTNQPSIIKSNLYYPQDLKTTMEKYIKIAKNGYK